MANPPHKPSKLTLAARKTSKKPTNPKKYKGLPPGFRMRLCRHARPLTEDAISKHNDLPSGYGYRSRYIEVDTKNQPVLVTPGDTKSWKMYRLVERGKLECSGLIFLFESIPGDATKAKFLRAEPPVVSEGYYATDDERPTLKKALHALVQNSKGATHYVVARYRIEPKFAVHYWESFWDPKSVEAHLEHALKGKWLSPQKEIKGFEERLKDNRKAGKHYRIRRTGGQG